MTEVADTHLQLISRLGANDASNVSGIPCQLSIGGCQADNQCRVSPE